MPSCRRCYIAVRFHDIDVFLHDIIALLYDIAVKFNNSSNYFYKKYINDVPMWWHHYYFCYLWLQKAKMLSDYGTRED